MQFQQTSKTQARYPACSNSKNTRWKEKESEQRILTCNKGRESEAKRRQRPTSGEKKALNHEHSKQSRQRNQENKTTQAVENEEVRDKNLYLYSHHIMGHVAFPYWLERSYDSRYHYLKRRACSSFKVKKNGWLKTPRNSSRRAIDSSPPDPDVNYYPDPFDKRGKANGHGLYPGPDEKRDKS